MSFGVGSRIFRGGGLTQKWGPLWPLILGATSSVRNGPKLALFRTKVHWHLWWMVNWPLHVSQLTPLGGPLGPGRWARPWRGVTWSYMGGDLIIKILFKSPPFLGGWHEKGGDLIVYPPGYWGLVQGVHWVVLLPTLLSAYFYFLSWWGGSGGMLQSPLSCPNIYLCCSWVSGWKIHALLKAEKK